MNLTLKFLFICLFSFSGVFAQENDSLFKEYILEKEINVNFNRIDLTKEETGFHKSSNLSSTEEILSRFSGVSFIRRGNYAPEPVIRGLNTNQIDVTINGMRVMSACTDKMDPVTSYVETQNLGAIDISKGSCHSEVVSNIGGKINLDMLTPQFSSHFLFNGKVFSGYRSTSGNYKGGLVVALSDENYALNINGGYNNSGDYKTGGGNEIENSGFEKYNFSLNGAYKLDEFNILRISGIWDDAYDIGYPALLMDVGSAKARIAGLDLESKDLFDFFNTLNFKVYFNTIDHVMDDSKRNNGFRMDMPGKTKTFGSSLTAGVLFDETTAVTAGLEFFNSLHSADMTMYFGNSNPMYMVTWPDVRKNQFSFKTSLRKYLSDKFSVEPFAGFAFVSSDIESELGFNSLQIFNPNVSKKSSRNIYSGGINLYYQLFDPLTLSLSSSYSERFPTVSEEFGFYLYNRLDNFDYIGNTAISNEKNIQFEFRADYNESDIAVGTSIFIYRFTDYILGKRMVSVGPMTPGSFGVKMYENFDNALLAGFEANLIFLFKTNFVFSAGISYSYGELANRDPLPLIPPLNGVLSIRFTKPDYMVQLEQILAAKQHRVNTDAGESISAGYGFMNIRGEYTFNDIVKINCGVENIFDKEYYNHLDWLKIPQSGRNFYGGIDLNF